jgi:hypothetical protein
MMFSMFMLLAFYSVIFAIKRLFRNGVSKTARAQFVYKHISYVIVILISWQILLLHNYHSLFSFADFDLASNFYSPTSRTDNISYLFMFGNGIFLTLIRLQDPFYRFLIREQFWECFGWVLEEENVGIQSQPLNSYLA